MPVSAFSLAAAAGLSILSSATVLLSLGSRLVNRRASRLRRPLIIYGLSTGLWAVIQIGVLTRDLNLFPPSLTWRMPLYGLFWLATVQVGYIRTAAGHPANWLRSWLAAGLLTAGLLALESGWPVHLDTLRLGQKWALSIQAVGLRIAVLAWGVASGHAVLLLLNTYRASDDPVLCNRLRYLVLVVLLSVTSDSVFFASYWAAGSGGRILGLILLTYASINPRLPALNKFLRRNLAAVIAATTGIGFFWILLTGRSWLVLRSAPLPDWLLDGILAVFGTLVFYQLVLRLQEGLRHLVAGRRRNIPELMRRYSQRIGNVFNLPVLDEEANQVLQTAFNAQSGRLLLVNFAQDLQQNGHYHLQPASNPDQTTLSLAKNQPLAVHFGQYRQALVQDEIQTIAGLQRADEVREWLESQPVVVWVPIHNRDTWIGLLGAGPKRSGEPFDTADIELVQSIADQTAVALENARLVSGVMRINNEFRQAYAALEQSNQRLAELERTKSNFVTTAICALRAPLADIDRHLELLARQPEIQAVEISRPPLAGIKRAAAWLESITASMQDMLTIESGLLQLDLQPVNIGAIIGEMVARYKPQLAARRQVLHLSGLEPLPTIQGDPHLLGKAMAYLVENAILYTPEGGRITIQGKSEPTDSDDEPAQMIQISIMDTGVGLERRELDYIFEKLYRGQAGIHYHSDQDDLMAAGLGLGLAIARGIIAAHQGEIWCESPGYDPGRCPGSEFHIRLPTNAHPTKPVGNPLVRL